MQSETFSSEQKTQWVHTETQLYTIYAHMNALTRVCEKARQTVKSWPKHRKVQTNAYLF